MAASDTRQLQTKTPTTDPQAVAKVLKDVGDQVEPTPALKFTAGVQSSRTRRVKILVTDALGQGWTQRWRVRVFIADSTGAAVATQTVSLVTGEAIETIVPNQEWTFRASAAGVIELDVAVAAAGTRQVFAQVTGKPQSSGAVAWT